MTRNLVFLTIIAVVMTGCATYTEKTSPCVCDWQPLGEDDGKGAVA